MFKIIVLVLCVTLSSASVALRDPDHWKKWNNLDLLNEYMGGFDFDSKHFKEDSILNQLAQNVAENDDQTESFVTNYQRQTNENVLVFGITLNGSTTYSDLLNGDYYNVLRGMPGFLYFRYKNNTMRVQVSELKELMDLTRCDSLVNPVKCNMKACENLWRGGTGEFKIINDNYRYKVRYNNMLKLFNAMTDSDTTPIALINNTFHSETEKNENYEMTLDLPNFYGSGVFYAENQTAEWGIIAKIKNLLSTGGKIRATSEVQHHYIKVNLDVNEPSVEPIDRKKRSETSLRDVIQKNFKTMYEMFDRETVFKGFTKFGEGYALNKNQNINIIYSLSGLVNNEVTTSRNTTTTTQNLFTRAKQWPWVTMPPNFRSEETLNKAAIVQKWKRVLGLSMIPVNQDRLAGGLPLVEENCPELSTIVQNLADKMAVTGKFVEPDFTNRTSNTMVTVIYLNGATKINEFDFLLGQNELGKLTCYDNFSGQKHKVYSLAESDRYVCCKSSQIKNALDYWKKYNTFATAYAVTKTGDTYMVIGFSF